MNEADALCALAALGQETRLAIFRLLVKAGEGGLAAGDIAERLGVLQNTLSAHLKILSQAGLVTHEREGRLIRYRAGFTAMRDLLAFLMEDCCNGNPELCAPVIEAVTCGCN
ncbi:MAG: winged helix-turn-helix transcriptional regulator [Notoacmeibacter sp.]|nr:winged helix-turn-helix transcriptional regulator [Notoacmeibacter sp.]MCC0031658.1 winged helix-turn-helix transcriptional regulator [Brucellaceae bacterium]